MADITRKPTSLKRTIRSLLAGKRGNLFSTRFNLFQFLVVLCLAVVVYTVLACLTFH